MHFPVKMNVWLGIIFWVCSSFLLEPVMALHSLLACGISDERLDVLHLHIQVSSFCLTVEVLTMMPQGEDAFCSCLIGVLCVPVPEFPPFFLSGKFQ